MTMDMLTVLQTAGIFSSYLLVTVGLPAFVFGKRLKEHQALERFLFYFTTGNFYIMNVVFLLQLLKISYPVTLVLFTVAPAMWAWVRLNQVPVSRILDGLLNSLKKISRGFLGLKTVSSRIGFLIRQKLQSRARSGGRLLIRGCFDLVLTLLFFGMLFWLYGGSLLQAYGYKASDMPVHNYWINALGENHIFVAGVYPHGFHCVLYYLHAVFGFDTYNVLRIFGFVQCIMLHAVLLCFLKLCCRTRYAAYAGAFLYAGSTCLAGNTYSRFYSALPQEFGILFILPAVYFGFAYFRVRREELAGKKKQPVKDRDVTPDEEALQRTAKRRHFQRSWLYLAGFAMSFSMTLAVHFYGTMVAGLFCAAMAIGYGFLFFRRDYFKNIVFTCLLSVVIAVFPMAAAYAGGTPLQGSLKWGMNVITGEKDKEEKTAEEAEADEGEHTETDTEEDAADGVSSADNAVSVSGDASAADPGEGTSPLSEASAEPVPEPERSLQERLSDLPAQAAGRIKQCRTAVYNALTASVLRLPQARWTYLVMDSFLVLIGLGIVHMLLRQSCYGAMLLSCGLYMLLMCVMMAAHAFGLPALMDSNRGSIYFAYSLPVAVSFLADGVLSLLFLPVRPKLPMHALSLGCVVLTLVSAYEADLIREPRETMAQEMNEAITCMENILANEEDFTWTIISANDELRMGTDHGYHYETITFLEDMEGKGSRAMIRIPTPSVYIFIEKIPLDYYLPYEDSGQEVSEEGAAQPLPPSVGIRMYQGEQRWMLMSRMYYWAQEFKRLYPNEVETYLETEQFVCYRVEQNPYRLYNFAIDYGYNTQELQLTGEKNK